MVARSSTDTIPEYYDEGFLPWPWPEDEVPERMPIEMMQSPTIKQILMILLFHLEPSLRLFVDTNTPIRFNPNNRRVFIAPDICIAFDVDVAVIRLRESYDLWEVGKPPEFVLEVASRSTYRRDLYQKPEVYAYIGAEEYWMFDPTGGDMYGQALAGYRLVDGRYEPIDVTSNEHGFESGYSEALGAGLCSVELSRQAELVDIQPHFVFLPDYGNHTQLLLQDAETGLYIPNGLGLPGERDAAVAERDAERERATQAETHAMQAETHAMQAEARATRAEAEAARLRQQLRRLEQD